MAQSQIGITESPSGSNKVKYNRDYYGSDVSGSAYPWCCVFVWWVFNSCSAGDLFYGGEKTASCTTLMNYHKKRGQTVTDDFRPGDILLMNFHGVKYEAEHTGIVHSVNKNGTVNTIEGNTSVTSNDNGGAVMYRTRPLCHIVCAIRPEYDEDAPTQDENSIAGTGNEHSSWAEAAIKEATELGLFKGDGHGNYGWLKPITREAMAQVVVNLLTYLDKRGK